MRKRIRGKVGYRTFQFMVDIVKSTTRVFAVIGIIAMLWNYVPWDYIRAESQQDPTPGTVLESVKQKDKAYPTTDSADYDISNVELDYEVIEKRTANSKTFRKLDGTYEIALYNENVHYIKNNKWYQIDNTLFDNDFELENSDNIIKVKFPKAIDHNKQIKLDSDEYSINWNILNISKTDVHYSSEDKSNTDVRNLTNIADSVMYYNIQPGVHLEYILTGTNVKENIILNSYRQDYSISFEYKVKNLEMIKKENGDIVFVNELGETLFLMNDLYMSDSNGVYSEDIELKYEETGNKTYLITLLPSDEWMSNASYPITIDPTISYNSVNSVVLDKQVPQYTSPTPAYNMVGYDGSDEYRAYFGITLDNLQGFDSKQITYAFLRLNCFDMMYTTDGYANLQLREVDENTSYEDINSIGNYTSASGDKIIDYNVIEYDDLSMNPRFFYWDISKNLRSWIENNDTSRVLELRKSNNDVTVLRYESMTSPQNEIVKPNIVIGYQDVHGIKDYWTYTNVSAGSAGEAYISDFTGEMTFIRNDFLYETDKQSLGLSMMYNIEDVNSDIGYGYGWKTSYSMNLLKDEFDNYYTIDGTNKKVFYTRMDECDSRVPEDVSFEESFCYIAEDGSRNILVIVIENSLIVSSYVLTPNFYRYYFEVDGFLKSISNTKYNNSITITRNTFDKNKIISIKDDSDNKLSFTYLDGRLQNITLKTTDGTSIHTLEKVVYSYQNSELSGTVKSTNYVSSTSMDQIYITDYYYDINHRLTTTTLNGQNYLDFYYVSATDNKIDYTETSIYDGSSNTLLGYLDFTYGDYHTKIMDYKGNYITKYFDVYGHTTSIINNHGVAQHISYMNPMTVNIGSSFQPEYVVMYDANPNYLWNNQVVAQSGAQMTTVNPVFNHSFEFNSSPFDIYSNWSFFVNNVKSIGSNNVEYTSEKSVYGN